ncbi:hypothetical protein [Methylobacterium radiodurans]|uniref:Ribbon-helix-helix protein CopG domain-containing protein n=1 Tax=Methylobacterium radiodurans TaxID=2202828 RepID=A0A2U8VTT8_9HYPH|nr:hypothetical protein [Methylobacterium radiodurans]AWN36526.1 hypothetical protein DK427_12960 [Methylobacterium radiodurans]
MNLTRPHADLQPASLAAHTERLDVPVSLALKRAIGRAAAERGMPVAELVREAVASRLLQDAQDLAANRDEA